MDAAPVICRSEWRALVTDTRQFVLIRMSETVMGYVSRSCGLGPHGLVNGSKINPCIYWAETRFLIEYSTLFEVVFCLRMEAVVKNYGLFGWDKCGLQFGDE